MKISGDVKFVTSISTSRNKYLVDEKVGFKMLMAFNGSRFESNYGQECFILQFSLYLRASQLDKAITNEIKRGIHLAFTLF